MTQTPLLENLYERKSEYQTEANALLKSVTAKLVDEWKTAGGCQNCFGDQRYVSWSTLDGPGYTEYRSCEACTPESKALGRQPGAVNTGYGMRPGNVSIAELFNHYPSCRNEAVMASTYEFQIELLNAEISAEEDRLRVTRGKNIVVVAGRKIPKGTKGECFWVGDTKYGLRVGFTGESGETFWTAFGNVEVAA